jgi:alkylation response protein AidB-like acyl-CoA dehydrogenase
MQFAFTEEQDQFRDIVARFCRDKSPTTTVRKLSESDAGFDGAVWKQMCQEVGVTGIHIPESQGGTGFSAIELGIVMEEFGRSLIPAPYFSCGVLACTAVSMVDDQARRDELLGPMIQGDRIGTLAMDPRHGSPISDIKASGNSLSGTVKGVLDAASVDFMLLLSGSEDAATLHLVDAGTQGVTVDMLRTMDGTRRLASVSLDNAAATTLAELDGAQVRSIYDTALVALANEMVGGAQALFDSAVAYTKMRVQFGRPIGSFQAIKHRLADLHVDVEMAKVAAWQAAAALASDEDVSVNASLAKAVASDAYVQAALETIQLHGGIGFTWENDTHLWYRRAKSSEVFLGTPAFHRERMLKEMNV